MQSALLACSPIGVYRVTRYGYALLAIPDEAYLHQLLHKDIQHELNW